MGSLGRKQLDRLAGFGGVHTAQVVPDEVTRSLCKRGLMESISAKTDGFIVVTAAGYRAIADAMDQGKILRPPIEDWNKPRAKP